MSDLENDVLTVPEVLSATQAARFLGLGRNALYDGAARGEIPHRRVGKRLLFSRAALLAWLSCSEPQR